MCRNTEKVFFAKMEARQLSLYRFLNPTTHNAQSAVLNKDADIYYHASIARGGIVDRRFFTPNRNQTGHTSIERTLSRILSFTNAATRDTSLWEICAAQPSTSTVSCTTCMGPNIFACAETSLKASTTTTGSSTSACTARTMVRSAAPPTLRNMLPSAAVGNSVMLHRGLCAAA